MPKHMRRDALLSDRRTGLGSGRRMLLHQLPQSIQGQHTSPGRWEDRVERPSASDLEPGSKDARRLTGQGDAALLAPLARAPDVSVLALHDLLAAEVGQLRGTEAGLDREEEQRMVTSCAGWPDAERPDDR